MPSNYDDEYTAYSDRSGNGPARPSSNSAGPVRPAPASPSFNEQSQLNPRFSRSPQTSGTNRSAAPNPASTPAFRYPSSQEIRSIRSSAATEGQRRQRTSKSGRSDPAVSPEPSARFPASLLEMPWLSNWPLVMLIIFGIVGTAGTVAVVSLFRMPNLPNCRAIFWPTASASLRLQCAESYAAKGDVKSLLAAIDLVDQLPQDHPLRQDIDERIESWASQVLDLAEKSFEAGELEEAIETAKKIPAKTAAAGLVEARIGRWQKIWQEGEGIYNSAIAKLKAKNFQQAFSLSVKLLDVDNKHWSTVRYNELTQRIAKGREDSRKMSEALDLAKDGTLKGFTEALKRLKEIDEDSVFYSEAQAKRKDIAKQMLAAAEQLLADQQLSDAQAMLSAIPRDTGLDKEIEDFQIFVTAYQQAWTNTPSGLESAINRMKTLKKGRPLYARGQELIASWQAQLNNLALLNQAEERALRGATADLTAAISIARQVSQDSPQGEAAAKKISEWQARVETVQDRPILEEADRLASVGTPDNLRAAIQTARKISSGRTLSDEAGDRIARWSDRIQRIEDQPLLDQARQRANTGDLPGAIAVASRIGEGRALYGAAQDEIAGWQAQEDGRSRLSEATTVAARGDGRSLGNAISIAQQVPSQSSSRATADSQIERWSWDLLQQAEAEASRNLEAAISLAEQIPSQAEAYEPAQLRIANWQETLRSIEASRRPIPAPVERDEAIQGVSREVPERLNLVLPDEANGR